MRQNLIGAATTVADSDGIAQSRASYMYCTARHWDCCLFVSDFAVANIFVQEYMCVAFSWRWCRPNVVLVRQTFPIVCRLSRRVLCVNACGLVCRCTATSHHHHHPCSIPACSHRQQQLRSSSRLGCFNNCRRARTRLAPACGRRSVKQ